MVVSGEIAVDDKIDCETAVRRVVMNIGFESFVGDLSWIDSERSALPRK